MCLLLKKNLVIEINEASGSTCKSLSKKPQSESLGRGKTQADAGVTGKSKIAIHKASRGQTKNNSNPGESKGSFNTSQSVCGVPIRAKLIFLHNQSKQKKHNTLLRFSNQLYCSTPSVTVDYFPSKTPFRHIKQQLV